MGGMIVQVLGYRHPGRIRSVVSIMSSTGNPALPRPTPEAMEVLMTPSPRERDAHADHHVRTAQVSGSPGYPIPEPELREMANRVYDRAFDPAGVARQLAAVFGHGDRRERLAGVKAPTLVIHGIDDPLVPVEGGRDTAAHVPGARLMEIPGMGHDVPPGLAVTLADAIASHTHAAESDRSG